MTDVSQLKNELTQMVEAANDLDSIEAVRVSALGKKGKITALMKTLGGMDPEERKTTGAALNLLKDEIAALIASQEYALKKQALEQRLATETIDVSLSARPEKQGKIHPISQTMEELTTIFGSMGFIVSEGPDIEDDWHNFTALNFPPGHPAREMHDTFYLPDDPDETGEAAKKLLRTHTSTVQIRAMVEQGVPIKTIVMGRTYRSDYDITHTPMFHQCEGLVIDKDIHMGHLKGCLQDFAKAYFEVDDLPVQFRPSFFPFTEPSAEVDIGCSRKDGGLKIGAGEDWLEILGCGMVHPNVIKNCGYDPEEYQGFAFGMGVERITMLKYGIPDLRTFFESDIRWLQHYGFDPLDRPNRATGTK
ncbi:MAG: phenylalanine--tRNA ligase subunit alpha [Alphaproteobacteria bacterium]|nr:phenylalanine--tRNA ligase subunit alpha [Alphaproteobacteria bacterium]NCQ89020.1 phenylalanine--tRNA ligase subunit alpha [Alphaproteobacteria bacterium]NCT07921.1 phenylalanine--tRNA ligase subunit alpha [Alphaproteobacteria bacterium]